MQVQSAALNQTMSEHRQEARGSVPRSNTSGHPALMQAIAESRDKRAFGEIFEYYAPRLKAYLVKNGAQFGIVEELVQEVMLTAWRRAPLYRREQGGVSTWLYTIARNAYIDHLRREKQPMFDVDDPAFELMSDEDTEKEILMRENATGLHNALKDLAPEQLEIIKLFYFGHRTHTEIAAELKIPLGTVKSRVRLAVEHLRKTMVNFG